MVPNGRSRREIGGPTGEDGLSAIALEGAMHRFHMLPGKQGQLKLFNGIALLVSGQQQFHRGASPLR